METNAKQRIISARHRLNELAELSGEEQKTRAFVADFLRENTSLQIVDCGAWLYAKHDEGADATVVVRADHDAIPTPGGPRHLCGHDGHTASLLGLALLLEGKILGKNVILLFQAAEETGAGAMQCCELFSMEGLTRDKACIIGCHNIPGEELGLVLFRRGTFACASCGVEITLTGSPTHAAYPENGRNPAGAAAQLALEIPAIASETAGKYACMTLATVVGLRIGERAFGVAASEGQLWVTLRSETSAAFRELNERVDAAVRAVAQAEGLRWSVERHDVFPATENDSRLQDRLEQLCTAGKIPFRYLDVPFRWSEDFGHYGQYLPACFFGIGAGTGTAPLHTRDYAWPDLLAPQAAELFLTLVSGL